MEKVIEFVPNNVCCRKIILHLNDDIITSAEFVGGCQGNLRGISALVVGMKVDDVITRLKGISCHGSRTGLTSCPDQLAKALSENK